MISIIVKIHGTYTSETSHVARPIAALRQMIVPWICCCKLDSLCQCCWLIAYLVCMFVLSPHRVFAAVVFTALSVGRASSFAPDLTKARVSASRILTLIRREPPIDSYSKEGLTPVSGMTKLHCIVLLV